VDPKKLAYRPIYRVEQRRGGRAAVDTVVSVPDKEEVEPPPTVARDEQATVAAATRHTEMRYYLLQLEVDMGLDVWVARNNRSKVWDGQVLGRMPRMQASSRASRT
jgi:hypothetical protein